MNQQFMEQLNDIVDSSRILMNEPMKKHITFRVGGPADVLVRPTQKELPEILKLCKECDIPYVVIGNGSNLLVGDKGIRGLVIEMTANMGDISVEEDVITAGCGVLLSKIANCAAEHGLAGMEFAAGIPGTVGGAVVMNAGAYGGEMKDILTTATILTKDGEMQELSVAELDLSYRHSCIPEKEYIVVEVKLRLKKGDEAAIREQMKLLRNQRVEKQPLEYPSAGSTFKRPEGHFAGKLIMDAGLRGYQVGDAQVAEKHCGFVINRGNATAADIRTLMQDVTEKVQEQFDVVLEPEVKLLGEF